jgi:hypothetical protein
MPDSAEDFPAALLGRDRPGRAKYDWPSWADGKVWHFIQGQDFGSTSTLFAMAGRQWAARNGYHWEQRVDREHVWVRMTVDAERKERRRPSPAKELPAPVYDYDPVRDGG